MLMFGYVLSQKAGHRNITRAFRRKNKEWMARETTPLGQRRSGESRGPLIGGWVERNMNLEDTSRSTTGLCMRLRRGNWNE